MKQGKSPSPAPMREEATAQEQFPMQVDVKIHSLRTSGPVLANASVNLNGCFAIRGVKVVDSEGGPFVSMPSYKAGNDYKDVCFPCTKEFHQQFHQAVLDAYHQALEQLPQRKPEAQEAPGPNMGMSM